MQRKAEARQVCQALIAALLVMTANGCRLARPSRESSTDDDEGRKPRKPGPISLTNQDGRSLEFNSLGGRVLIVSFIYTRCPSPTMCPLITRKFVRVQRELHDVRDRARLLLITLDPEYDIPRVLKEYGEVNGADFGNFWFLTGSRENLERLEEGFGVYKREEQPGVYAHTTDVFLIDEQGNMRKTFPGAFWEVADVVDAALELLDAPKPDAGNQIRKVE